MTEKELKEQLTGLFTEFADRLVAIVIEELTGRAGQLGDPQLEIPFHLFEDKDAS